MRKTKIKKQNSLKIASYVLTVIWCIAILFPLFYLVSSSMKDDLQIYDIPPSFLPRPPMAISIYADYTGLADKGEDYLKEALQKDSTIAMYSTSYEVNKSGIFKLRFYGLKDNKIIYKSEANKWDLDLNVQYIYNRALMTKENLLEKYKKSIESVGYKYDKNSLGISYDAEKVGKSALNKEIGGFLTNKYGLEGTYVGVSQDNSYMYVLGNINGIWKLPKMLYGRDPSIQRFSILWFVFNTLIIVVFAVIAQIVIDSTAGYALSRLFKGRTSKILLLYLLAATMIPFAAYMMPMYVIYSKYHLVDSYLGMIIPNFTTSGFFVYLYKGFIDQLPKDLFESAKIDGASDFLSYFKICIPLMKPVTAVVAINTVLGAWNDFFWPYMIAGKETLWTLNVALYRFSQNQGIKQNFVMTFATISILPLLIFAAIFVDKLKSGIVFSGIKG